VVDAISRGRLGKMGDETLKERRSTGFASAGLKRGMGEGIHMWGGGGSRLFTGKAGRRR